MESVRSGQTAWTRDIGAVPRGGTHVFVGVEFDCAPWIDRANADRVVVFCQSAAPTR
jgi:hypothetical protein